MYQGRRKKQVESGYKIMSFSVIGIVIVILLSIFLK